MGHSRGRRSRDAGVSSCRAWAGGLDDGELTELRRRVEQDAVAASAFLWAHAERWDADHVPAEMTGEQRET